MAALASIFGCAGYLSFSLFVRGGVTTVPEVVDLPLAQAERSLADRGLAPRRNAAADRYDDGVPRGHVQFQDPAAGRLVKRGSRVELALSLGPARVEVPALAGRSLQEAQIELAAVGLRVGRTAGVFGRGVARGHVVEQDPAAGLRVRPDQSVDLYLSRDPLAAAYVMPDLAYRQLEPARALFAAHGLRVGTVKYEPYEGVPPGTVLRQTPLPGHRLLAGETPSLVVAAAGR